MGSPNLALANGRDTKSAPSTILIDGEFPMSQANLDKIAELIYKDAGIFLNNSKASLVYSRLSKRIRQIGAGGFDAYCSLVSSNSDGGERRELLSIMTTNFTRFFRENHHFEFLSANLLPTLLKQAKSGRRIRIWSAGCSDGQEPYSIALTLLEAMPDIGNLDVKILATDIDPKILAKAKSGTYDKSVAETVPAALLKRWFEPADDPNKLVANQKVKSLISFKELNLLAEWPLSGPFQAIFCRNVAIYFDEPTQSRLWSKFGGMLDKENGHLFIGHSERIFGAEKSKFKNVGITTFTYNKGAI